MNKGKISVTRVEEGDAGLSPVVAETFARISRGVVGVVNLHRTLAVSPEVFSAFIGLAHALRNTTEVPAAERELGILRVLERHRGHYEIAHHHRLARATGMSAAQVEATADDVIDVRVYTDPQQAVLRYADAFSAGEGVDDATMAEMRKHFDERQIVELTLTLSLYLGLAHLTNTLDVPAD